MGSRRRGQRSVFFHTSTASFTSFILFLIVGGVAACDGASVPDAGTLDVDAGNQTLVAAGYSTCGEHVCQPGTRCDDETTVCRPGCASSTQCAEGERCDGSVCRTSGPRGCTVVDDTGAVTCGAVTCAPSTWCRDPGAGVCLDGCRSSENCPCGQRCTTTAAAGSGACTDASGTPTCGDDVCQPGETDFSCPDDCTAWFEVCAEGCGQFLIRECNDFDDDACLSRCSVSTESEQRDFAACVGNIGGALCTEICLDSLATVDAGVLP